MNNETDLQYYINDDLRKLGIMHYHRKNSGGGKRVTANIFKLGIIKMAWPDLTIYPRLGKAVFVEVKWEHDKLSTEQEAFLGWALDNGYPFYTVRSVLEWEAVKRLEDI